jgi:hypothetical protein
MKTFDIPESYRITEADNHEAWTIFADREKWFALVGEEGVTAESSIVSAFIEAGHMKYKSGVWPTLGEVYEQWGREEAERERQREERERKHAEMMKVWNGQRAAKQKA